MRNYLRSNSSAAFSVQNPYAVNSEGGVALWELPAKFKNAYNPIIFRRSHWYFRADEYEPTQELKPNIVSFDSSALTLMYEAASDVFVTYRYNGGTATAVVPRGEKQLVVPNTPISIFGVSVSAGAGMPVAKDKQYIYISHGALYEDDNFIVRNNRILYLAVADIDTSYLDLYKADGTLGIKLGAESFNGITIFDVSAVVRTWFAEQIADGEGNIIRDGRLSVSYTVKGIGGIGTTYDMVAINGVAQIGENSDRTADVGRVLTCFDHLTLYGDYPLDYSVLSDEPISTPRGETIAEAISRVVVNDSEQILETEVANVNVFDEARRPIFLLPAFNIHVFGQCVPDKPFYVRWINQLGGIDYYMFSQQQEFRPKVKSSSVYEVYVENTNTARTNAKAHTISTENTVVVGAEGVPEREYEALARLPFAPTIEWYNERLNKWVVVTVSKFDGKRPSDAPCADIEIIFNLPTINTQF